MRKFGRTGSVFTTVIAAVAVLALFGTSAAVASGLITSKRIKNGTIKSIDVKDGGLKGVDILNGSLTGADIKSYSLSNQDVGVLFAQVNADATVAHSSGGVTALQPFGTGTYEVDFGRDISQCAFTGTVGEYNAGGTVGVVGSASDRGGNNQAVYVETTDFAGSSDDLPFQLIVVC